MQLILPFSSKALPTGEKLYRRKYGYVFSQDVGTTVHEIVVPYSWCKINEIEILDHPKGCAVNMKILDTTTGTYSSIPNYMFNQFGFNVNIGSDSFKDISQYDADVYQGMRIVLEISSPVSYELRVNIVFHEIKS